MKRMLKFIQAIVIAINLVILFQNVSLATDQVGQTGAAWDPKQMISSADTWGNGVDDGGVIQSTQSIVGTAINIIRIVGTGIAIIMLTYVAIKYMSAAPSEKAEFKKSAMALIVGAIVLFAATNILSIIANFASKNITETTNPVQGTIQVEE